jgi:hypothetical protein
VARADGEKKQISTTASTIVTIAIGAVVAYLGFSLIRFGAYALGEGETFIGISTLVVGGVLIGGVVTVIVSQLRAWLSGGK